MNATQQVIATAMLALVAALATSALAQEATPDPAPQTGTKTRAEVQAELDQARHDGSIDSWSDRYALSLKSVRPRTMVIAELVAARVSGELDRLNSENSFMHPPQRVPATPTIAQAQAVTHH
jgi:hypothetical protein